MQGLFKASASSHWPKQITWLRFKEWRKVSPTSPWEDLRRQYYKVVEGWWEEDFWPFLHCTTEPFSIYKVLPAMHRSSLQPCEAEAMIPILQMGKLAQRT